MNSSSADTSALEALDGVAVFVGEVQSTFDQDLERVPHRDRIEPCRVRGASSPQVAASDVAEAHAGPQPLGHIAVAGRPGVPRITPRVGLLAPGLAGTFA